MEIWKWFVSIGGVGVLAWLAQRFISRRDTRNDVRRSESRAKIDAAIELIRVIEAAALDYFQLDATDGRCRSLEISMKSLLTRLSSDCVHIEKLLPKVHACQLNRCYKQALTLNDFESAQRVARAGNDPLFENISEKARDLERALSRAFEKEFSPGSP
jgi:hypothetical protein